MNPTRTYERRNVWARGGGWDDPRILWYARGVAAMSGPPNKRRPLTDLTSWRFYAAIHGIAYDRWRSWGYWGGESEALPDQSTRDQFWDQCEHRTWFFLPWHRGYLLAFERIIRSQVIKLGGPDDWALPYWNYFEPGQEKLPPAFASPDWPDKDTDGANPLFVERRYGPRGDGDVFVDFTTTEDGILDLKALIEPMFAGVENGGSPGFGGIPTTRKQDERTRFGLLEGEPHNPVHGSVGGDLRATELRGDGLMSHRGTAGLDPIFWLHHANIDRLWEVWHRAPDTIPKGPTDYKDPRVDPWLDGPDDGPFQMPKPDGEPGSFTPRDVTDLKSLGYSYDDVTWPLPIPQTPGARLRRLGASAAAVREMGRAAAVSGETVELLGANRASLEFVGSDARTTVQLDPGVRRRVTDTLADVAATTLRPPDRFFLNLENVRSLSDAPTLRVFVGQSPPAGRAERLEQLVGRMGLFGAQEASDADGEHGGQGLTFVVEVTRVLDDLYAANMLESDALDVRFEALRPVPESAQMTIGRVSIYRQGD